MVQCCVPNCRNRSDKQNWKRTSSVNKNRKITFHSIPKDNTICNLWIDILNLSANISKSARICSDHFSEKSFDTNGLLTRLKPNELPLKVQNVEASTFCTFSGNAFDLPLMVKKEKEDFVAYTQPSASDEQSSTSDKQTMTSIPHTAEKATMVSLKRIYNSPEKCRLRNLLKYQKKEYTKKIRNLQQRIRRCNDQLLTLKNILNNLRQKRL